MLVSFKLKHFRTIHQTTTKTRLSAQDEKYSRWWQAGGNEWNTGKNIVVEKLVIIASKVLVYNICTLSALVSMHAYSYTLRGPKHNSFYRESI